MLCRGQRTGTCFAAEVRRPLDFTIVTALAGVFRREQYRIDLPVDRRRNGGRIMSFAENPISRRIILAAAATGGMLTASTLAQAQTGEQLLEPRRPGHGGSNPGPKNPGRMQQNPDIISPPATDHGTLPNLRFSFDDAHMRLESGGLTRQVTVRELAAASSFAPIARAPSSPRTAISLKWKSATSVSSRSAGPGRSSSRSQNAPRRIPWPPPAKG
jgi:hypothetical protein